jgi:hypothetical protein
MFAQSERDVFERRKRDIALSSLNRSNICAMNPTLLREILLRQAERRSEAPHFGTNEAVNL